MKKIIILLSIFCMLSLTGCQQIFVNKDDQWKLIGVSEKNIEDKIFYIKDGATFYPVYSVENNFKNNPDKVVTKSTVCWGNKDYSLIPTLNYGEIIAYASNEIDMPPIIVERFKDIGYTIGIQGGTLTKDNHIFLKKDNLIAGTSAYEELSGMGEKGIEIISFNNKPIDSNTLTKAGTFFSLEFGKEYPIEYYEGTRYKTANIKCDRWILQSYEMYQISQISTTKNGYLAIDFKDSMKSGYYMINGQGLFIYNAEGKNARIGDMNEPYYMSAEDQYKDYSQKYVLEVDKKTASIEFEVDYETDYPLENIAGVVIAPDDTVYNMDVTEEKLSLGLTSAMQGNWSVCILPKDLYVTNVKVNSIAPDDEAIGELFEFDFDEPQLDVMFKVTQTNIDEKTDIRGLWGFISDEEGNSKDFEYKKNPNKNQEDATKIKYTYLPAGHYTVMVYHYNDTEDINVEVIESDTIKEEEFVIVN